jgi:hypothetical protein
LMCYSFLKNLSLLANTGISCFDLSRTLITEVSYRADGAFQFLFTTRMTLRSVWSRTLSSVVRLLNANRLIRYKFAETTHLNWKFFSGKQYKFFWIRLYLIQEVLDLYREFT